MTMSASEMEAEAQRLVREVRSDKAADMRKTIEALREARETIERLEADRAKLVKVCKEVSALYWNCGYYHELIQELAVRTDEVLDELEVPLDGCEAKRNIHTSP